MLDFPNSPSVGQTFVSGGTTWTWDGTKWVAAGATGASSIYLPLTGGTLTGPLSGTSATFSGAATMGPASATNLIIPGGAMRPGGRLTVTSGAPVNILNVTAGPNVYYTPYVGNMIPLWNGTQFVWTPFQELTNVLANSSVGNAGPAAVVASGGYDLYVWNNAGTPRLTRSPAWTSLTARSAGAAQNRVNGLLVNSVAITNGPAAGYGTYVGSFLAGSTTGIDYSFGGAASGGVTGFLALWNMFNRVFAYGLSMDTGAHYNYLSAAIRIARGSGGNQIGLFVGQSEDAFSATYSTQAQLAGVALAYVIAGIGVNSATTPSIFNYLQNPGTGAPTMPNYIETTGLLPVGWNVISALESNIDATTANFFDQGTNNTLMLKTMM